MLAGLVEVTFDGGNGIGRMTSKELGGETWEVGDEVAVQSRLEGGKRWRKQGSVSKSDEFSGFGSVVDGGKSSFFGGIVVGCGR